MTHQSVTYRLETSRYRDFSQFFESIGLGLKNFGVKKKVSISVSKIFGLKKSLGIGLENFGLKKSLGIGLENIWSQKKVSVLKILVSKKVSVKFFGLVTQWM